MKSGRVLLVDDEPDHLEVLKALLDDEFDVVTAVSVAHALDALDRHDFHVVVSDFNMPGGSGLDVLRYALELDVIVTGLLLTGCPEQAAAAGGPNVRVISKAMAPDRIVAVVRAAVTDVVGERG